MVYKKRGPRIKSNFSRVKKKCDKHVMIGLAIPVVYNTRCSERVRAVVLVSFRCSFFFFVSTDTMLSMLYVSYIRVVVVWFLKNLK